MRKEISQYQEISYLMTILYESPNASVGQWDCHCGKSCWGEPVQQLLQGFTTLTDVLCSELFIWSVLLQSTIPSLTLLCKAPLFKCLKEPVKANVNLQMEQRKHTYVRKLKQPTEVLFVVLVSFSHLPGMFCYKLNNLPSPEWWDASSHTNQTNLPATSPASSGTYSSFPRQTTLVFAPRKCYFIFYLLLFILSPLMVKIKYS